MADSLEKVLLAGPGHRLPTVHANIPPHLMGRGDIEIVGVGTGCYLFANDGSDYSAWMPWGDKAPARSVEGVAHWLSTHGVPSVISSRSVVPTAAPRPAKPAPPPKPVQGSLF